MTGVLEVKGVRLRREALRAETLAFLERKLRGIRRRSRRRRNPFDRLLEALLPRDWGNVPVESRVEGRVLVVGCGGGIETLQLQAFGIDVSLHSYAEWETLLEEAELTALEIPRRRSGRLGSLAWKTERERRAARRGSRRGLSVRGLRIVTILARVR